MFFLGPVLVGALLYLFFKLSDLRYYVSLN